MLASGSCKPCKTLLSMTFHDRAVAARADGVAEVLHL